jgi:anti-anti-sigma factor
MDITESKINSATVLALSGQLDGLTCAALEKKVDALLAGGTRKLVFDCGPLVYASSAGLRVFLSSAKKLKAVGGQAAFAALTPTVHEVFELSGFIGIFKVESTVDAAVAAIA